MRDVDIRVLEQRVDALLALCTRLSEENDAMRHQQTSLMAERATLIEKSEQARSRVESMISRLKSMEL